MWLFFWSAILNLSFYITVFQMYYIVHFDAWKNYHFVVRHQSRYSWNWRYGSAAGCSCAGGIDELELGDARVPMRSPSTGPSGPSRYSHWYCWHWPWWGWSRRVRKCPRRSPSPLASSWIHLMREGWVSLGSWPSRLLSCNPRGEDY